ncbi:MAG: hypothetical protein JO300_06915 [Silvibacterium sp.]|nr:hypothetical protein [Silvibacterium sp.]
MPNGTLGDHPMTDILLHGHDVYSSRASALIREIHGLADDKTLRELGDRLLTSFNPYSNPDVSLLEQELGLLRDRLRADAAAGGFELPNGPET